MQIKKFVLLPRKWGNQKYVHYNLKANFDNAVYPENFCFLTSFTIE